MFPCRVMVERVAGLVEGDIFGQAHGKVRDGHRQGAAIRTMNDGDRAAPITLTRNAPVAQAVIDGAFAELEAFQFFNGGAFGGCYVEPVEEA